MARYSKSVAPSVVKSFMELVKVPSPTGHEERMTREVKDKLSKMGLRPKVDKEGNVIVFLPGDESRETLMLNAHIDTVQGTKDEIVPYIDKKGWVRSRGDTILGADNKTAVAAILEVIGRLTRNRVSHNPLEVVFTVSEESGNHGASGLDYKLFKSKRGYIFDASDRRFGDMIISSPAYARIDLKIVGKAAHASKPELANNVLPVFAKGVLKTRLGQINKRTQMNIGIVSAGEVGQGVNTIPGEIVLGIEVRTRDEKNLEKLCKDVIKIYENEAKKVKMTVKSKITKENGAYEFSDKDKFVKKTVASLKQMGLRPNLIDSWGCYEANIFAEYGITMLNIADGSKDTHTKNERVKVSDLERLEDLIYRLVTTD